VLQRAKPAEVYVPYYLDGPPDHLATTNIIAAAQRQCGSTATVCEYPVWFWYHWPWTELPRWGRAMLREFRQSCRRNWRLLGDFHWSVRIDDVLDLKREALARHRTQMEHLVQDPDWVTLGDIARGEWLKCFFQKREIFYRHAPAKA